MLVVTPQELGVIDKEAFVAHAASPRITFLCFGIYCGSRSNTKEVTACDECCHCIGLRGFGIGLQFERAFCGSLPLCSTTAALNLTRRARALRTITLGWCDVYAVGLVVAPAARQAAVPVAVLWWPISRSRREPKSSCCVLTLHAMPQRILFLRERHAPDSPQASPASGALSFGFAAFCGSRKGCRGGRTFGTDTKPLQNPASGRSAPGGRAVSKLGAFH